MASEFDGSTKTGTGWGWLLLYGVVSAAAGILAFLWPFAASIAVALVIGWFMVVTGVAALIAGFGVPAHSGRWYTILFGILSLLVGGYMIVSPVSGAISLSIVAVAWLLARGVMELIFGFRFRRLRWTMLLLGAIDLILAFWLLSGFPAAALALPGVVVGFSLVAGGIVALVHAVDHRKGAGAFS